LQNNTKEKQKESGYT